MKKGFILILALSLFGIWLYYVDPADIAKALKRGNLKLAFLGTLLGFAGLFFKGIRLHIVLKMIKPLPLSRSQALFFASFSLDYFLSLLGVISQVGLFLWLERIPVAKTLGMLVFLRLMDYLVIFPFLLLVVFYPTVLPASIQQLIGLGTLVLLGAVALLFTTPYLLPFIKRKAEFLGAKLDQFYGSLLKLTSFPVLISVAGLTLMEYALEAVGIWLLLQAFSVPANFSLTFFTQLFIQFFYLIPNMPAELGTHEWIIQAIFNKLFGFDRVRVGAAIIFSHFFSALYVLLSGTTSLLVLGISLKDFGKKKADHV